uniref:hypothetical protein n=1 Tax=Veillonella magna TaxID=464322 RepID=UPI00402A8852
MVVTPGSATKFIVCSALGLIIFFVTITINGKSTIPLDHLTNWVQSVLGSSQKYIVLLAIAAGAVLPFVKGTWNRSRQDRIFSFCNLIGLLCAAM